MTPPLSEAGLAGLLGEHVMSDGVGRNLGQYRIEWTCDCGETLISDGHRGLSRGRAHHAHLAAVLHAAILADREQAGRDALVDQEAITRCAMDWFEVPRARAAGFGGYVLHTLRQRAGEPS